MPIGGHDRPRNTIESGPSQRGKAAVIYPNPGYDRRAEVERLLEADDTVLGRLWKYDQEGRSPQEMTDIEGVATTGWVSNYRPSSGFSGMGRFQRAPLQPRPLRVVSARG